jgi:translation elongation factor P/translation initiation factor 5A
MNFWDIKKGVYLVFDNQYPCLIIKVVHAPTAKHGHEKKLCVGVDVITDKKYTRIFCYNTQDTLLSPKISSVAYQLNDINDDGYLILLDPDSGKIRNDLQMPKNDLGRKIKEMYENGEKIMIKIIIAIVKENTRERVMWKHALD